MAKENDIVLIYLEDKPLFFARVEGILADSKPDWYHVRFLVLQIPVQVVTWILRDNYINGSEFTMNGKKMRIEEVIAPKDPLKQENEELPADKNLKTKDNINAKVISMMDIKKK
ncbi:MAG: hypothetical protein HKO79_09505 [Desulfobacterales bacterium]|nr:hypothetical protein [Deltaproteobacteria bacterium]NNL42717.1 hypothetical protein [Desulfobacterales bacterium]